MGWDVLKRMIDLVHFVLLVLMISILFISNKSEEDSKSFLLSVENFKQDMTKVISANTSYLENKINRTDEKQDNYQNTSSNQIYLLSKRVDRLEQGSKPSGKVINNNLNTTTINGIPVSPN